MSNASEPSIRTLEASRCVTVEPTAMARQIAIKGRALASENKVPQAIASTAATSHRPNIKCNLLASGNCPPVSHQATGQSTTYIASVAATVNASLLARTSRIETGAVRKKSNVPSSRSIAKAVPAAPSAKKAGAASANV